MITLDDCPKRLDVCARRGVVRLVKPPPSGNAEKVAMLRDIADRIEKGSYEIAGVGVAVAYEDGDIGRGFCGNYARIIASVEVLRDAVMSHYR